MGISKATHTFAFGKDSRIPTGWRCLVPRREPAQCREFLLAHAFVYAGNDICILFIYEIYTSVSTDTMNMIHHCIVFSINRKSPSSCCYWVCLNDLCPVQARYRSENADLGVYLPQHLSTSPSLLTQNYKTKHNKISVKQAQCLSSS